MSGKYPCIGGETHMPNCKDQCEACGNPATHSVRVQFDYMRGNDEFYLVCQRHLGIARARLGQFFAHVKTKAKHLSANHHTTR